MKKLMMTMAMLLVCASINAQTTKVADKELIGTWMLEWMQYDGEKKTMCGKITGYTSFKYYGADGEYACCEIVLTKDGKVVLMPHEYGKYTYKNGVYSEMGRPAVKPSEMMLIDNRHFKGRWKNRTEAWKKIDLPNKVVRHIVERCKLSNTPADVEQSLKQNMFK